MNINKTTEATKATRSFLLCAAAVAALGAAGCAAEGTAQESDGSNDPLALEAPASKDLPGPNDSYFASVTANGTGCPAGTWETNLSPDGQTFTTTFNKFEVEVDKSKTVSIKDCQLNIKLHSPQGLQYAVQEFFYGGYVFLEDGVQLRQIANYYFSGAPDEGGEARSDVTGPYDDTILVEDKRREGQLVWQSCGIERNLQVRSTLRLLNTSNPRRAGYANIAAVDATNKLVFKLAWKKCDE